MKNQFSKKYINVKNLNKFTNMNYSQDYLFHTLKQFMVKRDRCS